MPVWHRPLTEAYWSFLRVRNDYLAQATPAVPSWMAKVGEPLDPAVQLIFDHIQESKSILDVGAGDGRIRELIRHAGYAGEYSTLDRSPEFDPDFRGLDEVAGRSFDTVILMEMIEHIPLHEIDAFFDDVLSVVGPRGRLVISTPNAEFISTIWSSDMTHVHAYRAQDLAAYLHLRGFRSTIYRIAWRSPQDPLRERIRFQLARLLMRGILNVDYAQGVLLLAVGDPVLAGEPA